MKLGRLIDNDKRHIPFEDGINWRITSSILFDIASLYFIIGEVKCNEPNKKAGGPGMCSTEHSKF